MTCDRVRRPRPAALPIRAFATAAVAAALTAGTAAAAGESVETFPAVPVGACEEFDPAAVADLSVVDAAGEIGELSTFSAAITAGGLTDDLAGVGPFTVFAPSSAAFEQIPDAVFDSMIADLELLASILEYHVVAGESLTVGGLVDAGTVATLNGDLTITTDGETLLVNDGEATVTCAGIVTANATIFVVDRVLQPATDSMCPGGTSVPGSSVPGVSVPNSVPGSSVPAAGAC